MTLLGIIQEYCRRRGLEVPQLLFGSQNDHLHQLVGLANEVIDDLTTMIIWKKLTKEATWTSTAAEDQGAITTLAPYGFISILENTLWDRTGDSPLSGPESAEDWQAGKALVTTGPVYSYRLRGGRFLLSPTMVAGHTLAFEYSSDYAVLATDGTTYKKYFTVDTDTFELGDSLLIAGINWKWRYEKGLRYAEDWKRYMDLVNTLAGRDGTKRVLNQSGDDMKTSAPAILVQAGSIS